LHGLYLKLQLTLHVLSTDVSYELWLTMFYTLACFECLSFITKTKEVPTKVTVVGSSNVTQDFRTCGRLFISTNLAITGHTHDH
jgi:hypothetical protein